VNDKLSVRRSYKKQIRTILHNWQKSGYDYAEKKYLNRYWRNRVNGIPKFLYFKIGQPKLLYSLRGKIEFVGFICGRESNEYTKFNSKFNELYNRDFGDK
jgi:RNA-directed DNA polymerase